MAALPFRASRWIGLLYYLQSRADAVLRRDRSRGKKRRDSELVRARFGGSMGAMGTVIFGLLYLLNLVGDASELRDDSVDGPRFSPRLPRPVHVGQRMVVIWPNQKIVIVQRSRDGWRSAGESRRSASWPPRRTRLAHQHSLFNPDALLHGRREPLQPLQRSNLRRDLGMVSDLADHNGAGGKRTRSSAPRAQLKSR